MRWTIRTKLMLLVGIACSSIILVIATAWWTTHRQAEIMSDMERSTGSLRLQQDMDMMHDAVRADVMGLQLAADAKQFDEAKTDLTEHAGNMRTNIKELNEQAIGGKAGEALAAVTPDIQHYLETATAVFDAAAKDRTAVAGLLPGFNQEFHDLEGKLSDVSGLIEERIKLSRAEGTAFQTTSACVLIGASLVAMIMAIMAGVIIANAIVKPIQAMVATMQRLAAGDLTVSVTITTTDEIGEMGRTLNTTVEQLHQVMGEIREAADQTAASGEELSASAQNISSGAQSQAGSVEAISASIQSLAKSIGQVAQDATEANQVAQTTSTTAEAGAKTVGRSIEGMKAINDSSAQIAKIIGVINQIANQTNLLALNAAIEAASAGEHGLGFAVVADEVRKLAERSSTAAQEIAQLIEESGKRVNDGTVLSQEVGKSLHAIIEGITRTKQGMAGIGSSTEKQTETAQEVSKGIEGISAITEENSASAEEMAASAEELSAQAQRLQSLVARFTLGNGESRDHTRRKTL